MAIHPPTQVHSFTPDGTNPPGDRLDAQFQDHALAITDTQDALAQIRRADGALKNGIVTKDTLDPNLLASVLANINAQTATDVNAADAARTAAQAAALMASNSALTAQQAVQAAVNAAQTLVGDATSVQAQINAAQNLLQTAINTAQVATIAVGNLAGDAKLSENKAKLYATLALNWAEYMPEQIPANLLAEMGITGDHWSSRWWATRAANAFGHLTSLYLGAHPDLNTALANAVQPIAIGAIYYDTTQSKPFIWNGSAWMPFWSPQKALTTTLFYRTTAPQTDFPLSTPDLFTNTFALDKKDTEPLELYVNGVRMFPSSGTPPAGGDYTIDVTNNKVVLAQPLPTNAVVTIDILTPRDKFAVGSVNFHALLDLDLDPATRKPGRIDGVETSFSLMCADGTTPAIGSAVELFVSVDGVIQHAGVDYNVTGTRIRFTDAPRADSKVWALWMEPSATGSGGKGVQPPLAPEDLHINAYEWDATNGGQWNDNRGRMHSVANAAARLALKDPVELIPGALVYERDTHNIWAYTPTTTTPTVAPVRQDISPTPGDPNFKAQILALKIGDTVLYKGQYYQVMMVPSLGEESFPGGTSYAINPAPFIGQFSPAAGPSWNGYKALAPGQTAPAPAAATASGDPTKPTSWSLLLPGHPNDGIMRGLEYDPSKPNSMAWEDSRDEMETVGAEADLNSRTLLPLSHLMVGKLVYVRATGQLWECLIDGTTGTATNTIADWKQLGGAGVTFVGRVGNLPDPTAKSIPDGSLFMVNMDTAAQPYHRLYVFDANGTNSAGVKGIYRPAGSRDFIKALRTDADHGLDSVAGDLQATLENGHKELKAFDAAGAWQTIYSEDLVKAWIAAGNLFQGTVQDKGHGTVGAIDLDNLPAQSALGVTDSGHYYIYVGLAGHVVGAAEIGSAASNINGAKLNVGDWILVANTGTPTAPVMKYTHVPGDLLAKTRGDNLYGLNAWAAGAYEIGSLVVYNGDIYKAASAVLAADPAPGVAPTTPGATNPWVKVQISGGVKTVAADANLPAGAPNGAVYLVLSSAQAGGKGAMYMWDAPSSKWQALGGGGIPLSLGGGKKLTNYGTPIGTVITFAGKTLPAGYLLCDGSTFDATTYPELNTVLGGNTLPDLRSQFIRGAPNLASVSFTKHGDSTKMPTTHFTGATNSAGAHVHGLRFSLETNNPYQLESRTTGTAKFHNRAAIASSGAGGLYAGTTSGEHLSSAGAHTHTVEITGGGDSETAPAHVILAYLIKADDIGVHGL